MPHPEDRCGSAPSASNSKASIPPWKKPAAFRPVSAADWNILSTRSIARSAVAAVARRRGRRAFPRTHDRRDLPPAAGQDAGRLPRLEANRHRAEDRRRGLPRDLQSDAVPGRRGTRLPHACPAGPHAFRRRDAAYPPRGPSRQRAVRRALRVGRADDRPAPPRQRPPAGRPEKTSRPGQHPAAGRARSRGDRQCRPTAGLRPGAGRHGGQIVAEGSPEQVGKRRGSVTGPYLTGKKAIAVPTNRRMAGQGAGSGEQAEQAGRGAKAGQREHSCSPLPPGERQG